MDKSFIRKDYIKKRSDIDISYRDKAAFLLADNLSKIIPKGIIAAYYPFRGEISPLFINPHALPIIKNELVEFHQYQKDNLSINKFGIFEPKEGSFIIIPDVIIIPLVAFDEKCNRLGYGGGFYDRTLPLYPFAIKIGVGFAMQQYQGILPHDEHDISMDYIATEHEIIKSIKTV